MSWTVEVESPVSAVRLYRAALLDWHNLAPKVKPDVVPSAAVLEGDGGVGSVRQINFTSVMPFEYIKERLDYVDHDKCEAKMSLIGGGELGKKIESATSHFKFVPTSGGGCVCKVVANYKVIAGVTPADEEAKAKESVVGLIKAAEAYLLANPTAYA